MLTPLSLCELPAAAALPTLPNVSVKNGPQLPGWQLTVQLFTACVLPEVPP